MGTNMEEGVKERLIKFLKYKNISQKAFQDMIGVSNGFIYNISRSIGVDKQKMIHEKFPDLNIEWLLIGEGDMISKSENFSISMTGNNKTGNIHQGNGSSASYDDLYKQIIELKDKLASIKNKVFRARICPTIDEMQKKLDDIMLDEE